MRSARASSIDWDPGNTQAGLSDGSGNWDAETADWYNPGLGSPDVVWNDPNIDSAVIGAGSAGGTLTADDAVGVTVGAITVNSGGTYTLAGTPINLGAALTTITVNSTLLNVSNVLEGTGGLTVTGSSATNALQIQSGSNTYTGGTTLNGVTVNIAKGENAAINNPFGATNGTLVLTGTNTINGSGSSSGSSISYATPYNINISGTTTINTGKSLTLQGTGYTTTGNGTLIFNDSGSASNFTSNIKGGFAAGFTGKLELEAATTGANIRLYSNGGSFAGVPNGIFDMEGGSVAYTASPQTNSQGNAANNYTFGALEGADPDAIYAGGSAGGSTNTFGGALNLSTSFAGSIQGNNAIKIGGGSLTFTNSNTYTGSTVIGGTTNGTLFDNGPIPNTSGVTVATTGVLAGIGTLGGAVVSNGAISPGATAGTIGTLKFLSGLSITGASSAYDDNINLAGSSDLLAVTGALTLGAGSTLNVNVLDSTSSATYIIASYSGSLTGTFATTNLPLGYAINYGTGSNSVITLSVPEPVSGTLCMIGLAGTCLLRRRRKSVGA